jgi:hypothetical protein
MYSRSPQMGGRDEATRRRGPVLSKPYPTMPLRFTFGVENGRLHGQASTLGVSASGVYGPGWLVAKWRQAKRSPHL